MQCQGPVDIHFPVLSQGAAKHLHVARRSACSMRSFIAALGNLVLMVPTLECHSLVYLDQEVFLSSSWHDAKLSKIMWDGLLDYGKLSMNGKILYRKSSNTLTKRLSCSKNLTGFAL